MFHSILLEFPLTVSTTHQSEVPSLFLITTRSASIPVLSEVLLPHPRYAIDLKYSSDLIGSGKFFVHNARKPSGGSYLNFPIPLSSLYVPSSEILPQKVDYLRN